MFRGRILLAAAAVAALAAVAAPASATVVLQQGIAGVTIGMSRDTVRSLLGKPRGVKNGKDTLGRYIEYRYPKLLVRFQGLQAVTLISTSRKDQRTARGVGVGSTKAQVKARIRGVSCRALFGARYCYVGVRKPGRRATFFYLNERNRVVRVAVGLVVD